MPNYNLKVVVKGCILYHRDFNRFTICAPAFPTERKHARVLAQRLVCSSRALTWRMWQREAKDSDVSVVSGTGHRIFHISWVGDFWQLSTIWPLTNKYETVFKGVILSLPDKWQCCRHFCIRFIKIFQEGFVHTRTRRSKVNYRACHPNFQRIQTHFKPHDLATANTLKCYPAEAGSQLTWGCWLTI